MAVSRGVYGCVVGLVVTLLGFAIENQVKSIDLLGAWYVERNPVRARMVWRSENYPWSSAAAHCGKREDKVLTTKSYWKRQFESIGDWSAWLAEGDSEDEIAILRRNVEKGLPCGAERFIRKLERRVGRLLRYRPMGRPRIDQTIALSLVPTGSFWKAG